MDCWARELVSDGVVGYELRQGCDCGTCELRAIEYGMRPSPCTTMALPLDTSDAAPGRSSLRAARTPPYLVPSPCELRGVS